MIKTHQNKCLLYNVLQKNYFPKYGFRKKHENSKGSRQKYINKYVSVKFLRKVWLLGNGTAMIFLLLNSYNIYNFELSVSFRHKHYFDIYNILEDAPWLKVYHIL